MSPTKPKTHNTIIWLTGILFLLAAATLVIQILRADANTTKTETTLYGILQFVFSLGFAWLLARSSFRKEFEEGQKRFAIAAYRRIRGIERTTDRLLLRTIDKPRSISPDEMHEVDIIRQIAIGIQDAVRSSIADWADIIGEEIATIEKIEEITTVRAGVLEQVNYDGPDKSHQPQEGQSAVAERLETLDRKLSALKQLLPASLQVLESSETETFGQLAIKKDLTRRLRESGFIELDGFWEANAGFERSILDFSVGDRLSFTIGDVGNRIGIIVAHDDAGKSVGMVPRNFLPGTYEDFLGVLVRILGRSRFQAEITSIEKKPRVSGRVYFKFKLAPNHPTTTKET